MVEKSKLTLADLHGDMVVTKLIHPQQTERSGETMLLLSVEAEDKQYRVGVIGEKVIAAVLSHGEKKEDGSIYLTLPRIVLNPSGIGWLNFLY